MTNKIDNILSQYQWLIPKKEYASMVILLHKKIRENELEEFFTYEDIEQSSKEVHSESTIQIEKAVLFLLHYFLIKNTKRNGRYSLTQYARNFVALISNKIDSPYSNLPLRENFEKYFNLNDDDLNSVEQFESWFILGFGMVSKNIVSDHIESLYDDLKLATDELNNILHLQGVNAIEQVSLFSGTFDKFILRSREIREVVNLKNDVLQKIDSYETKLYTSFDLFSPKQRLANKPEFEKSKQDWNSVKKIAIEVKLFFNQIDDRLENITNQILFASKKLNELGENFEKQSLLKVNLKKILRCALEDIVHVDDRVQFNSFALKAFPYQSVCLNTIGRHEFEIETDNVKVFQEVDEEYFISQRDDFLIDLNNQERVSIWINNLSQRLESEKKLDLTTEFFKILDEEGNTQVPLRVSYELINANQSEKRDTVLIDQTLTTNERGIYLWKIILNRK